MALVVLHQVEETHSVADLFGFDAVAVGQHVVDSEDVLLGDLSVVESVHEVEEGRSIVLLACLAESLVTSHHES